MPRFVDYECEKCGYVYEEMFSDTEVVPKGLTEPCPKCQGKLVKGLNLKNNSQCWRVHLEA